MKNKYKNNKDYSARLTVYDDTIIIYDEYKKTQIKMKVMSDFATIINELVDVVIMAEEILSMQKNCLMYMHYLPLQQEIKIND